MKANHIIWGMSLLLLLSSCTIVCQGEVGVKRNLGKLNFKTIERGP